MKVVSAVVARRPWPLAWAAVALTLSPWLLAGAEPARRAVAAQRVPPPPAVFGKPGSMTDVQDFVFLGEPRPVLIRLHVTVDGKPLLGAWNDFVSYVFKQLDADGDGVLNKAEAARVPQPQLLFNSFIFGFAELAATAVDTNNDGKVSRDELARYYRTNGGAPFQVYFGPGNQGAYVITYGGMDGQQPTADALNEAMFGQLDKDKDGKLSRDELTTAESSLRRLDVNDDDMITVQELMPGSGGPQGLLVASVRGMGGNTRPATGLVAAVTPGEPSADLARQLLARYGSKGNQQPNKRLTRKDLGLDEATFGRIDADADGELDAEELARFGQRPPDVELTVRLGKRTGEAAVEEVAAAGRRAPGLKKLGDGVSLSLGTTRLDLRTNVQQGGVYYAPGGLRQNYQAQFKGADRDNNGYLDRAEVRQNGVFGGLFKAMDRDGDGKLFEKEMVAYLTQAEDFQKRAQAGTSTLSISDQGKGLFDLIDTSRDSRLGVRELRRAVKLLETLDRGGDGHLSKSDIPRSYLLNVQQGASAASVYAPRVFAYPGGMGQPTPNLTAGPVWFRKMDRNRDGDVSRREFLGTEEEFNRIDADGDGLISVEEAGQVDAKGRK